MIVTVAFVGVIAMFFASLPRKSFKYGLEVAWIIIGIFLAIRYDFGNDYLGYLDGFNYINSWATFQIYEEMHAEPGWQLLCYLFRPLGFFAMVAVLTLFECYVIYRLIKAYVPERYYWLSIFLYVFTPSMMLIGASMMRQMLAIAIVLCGVKYIERKRLIPFIILIFLASQIHSSATILYPLFLLGYIKDVKKNNWVAGLIVVAYVALSFFSTKLAPIINEVAVFVGEEESLEYYTENAVFHEGFGLGYFLQIIIFVYLIFTLHRCQGPTRLLFLLLLLGTFVEPFASQIPLISRFSYYFNIFSIVCYPFILGGAKDFTHQSRFVLRYRRDRVGDVGVICLVVILTLYGYVQFFKSPIWIEKFSTYHTIFSV